MVLHGSIPRVADAGRLSALRACLPYARRLELESTVETVALASLYGIALAIAGLRAVAGRPFELRDLHFPKGGKPRLDGPEDFSISHSDRRVGCAVTGVGSVGFDLEEPGVQRSGIDVVRWTAIEAVLKAAGAGLIRAQDVELNPGLEHARLDGFDYWLFPLRLGDAIAHVAADEPCAIETRELALDDALAQCMSEDHGRCADAAVPSATARTARTGT